MNVAGSSYPLTFGHDVFFGDLRLSRALDGITLSHRTANAPPEIVGIHTHLDTHFVLVTAGRYLSSAKGNANPRATLIYNPPGTTHRDHFLHGTGAFFSISISNSRLAALLAYAPQPAATHLEADRSCGLAVALLMECTRWDCSSALKSESLCLELLAAVSKAPRPATKSPPAWLRTVVERIQDCPGETPNIRELASAAGIHPAHLARIFRRFLACTPGDFLRARRLEIAAAALTNSKRSLVEIALSTGFSDQAQFTNAFRRLYGVPPGAYRSLGGKLRCRKGDVAF